jgi:hypothetical protein
VVFLPGCRAGRLDLDESEAEKKKRREEEERQQARIKAMQVHISFIFIYIHTRIAPLTPNTRIKYMLREKGLLIDGLDWCMCS